MKIIEKDSETSDEAKGRGLRRIKRRHFAEKGAVTLKDCKVKVTIYLDADVLSHFKERAAAPHAAPYQTQINAELRRIVEGEMTNKTKRLAKNLTEEKTINRLAELLAEKLDERKAA